MFLLAIALLKRSEVREAIKIFEGGMCFFIPSFGRQMVRPSHKPMVFAVANLRSVIGKRVSSLKRHPSTASEKEGEKKKLAPHGIWIRSNWGIWKTRSAVGQIDPFTYG